jgi:hypothetical protein
LKSIVEILAFVNRDAKTDELFNNIENVQYIQSKDELKKSLNRNDYFNARIVVVSIEYILDKQSISYLNIKRDLMYKNASIVIYGKDIDFEVKYKLYALDIKGIIDENDIKKREILSHIKRRSNLYSSTFKNNAIRGIIEYNNLSDKSKTLTYLLDYLIYKYHISNKDSSDIRLTLISLFIAFKQNKILQTAKLISTIFKSQSINKLYKNYTKPKSFNEKILSTLLTFNKDKELANYIENINLKSVEPELIKEIEEVYDSKNIAITSYQDVNFFWEQLYLVVLEKHADLALDIFDIFLSTTYNALLNFLVHTNYLLCSIELFNNEKIIIDFKFIGAKNRTIKEYADTISTSISSINILVDEEDDTKVSIIYDISSYEPNKDDNSIIDSTHYQDNKKISATEFLKDYEVDNGILDDLHDNAREIKDLLYNEEVLSQNTLSSIVTVLQKYASVLQETIEFEDIAYALEGLATLFSNLDINEIEASKKEMLSFYIQGLVDDLSSWKHHIFLDANTPDIHYLDASLLENSSTIEKFILSNPQEEENNKEEENDDDLEFF